MQSIWGLDQEIFRAIHIGWHRDWLDPFFWVVSTSGLGWVELVIVGLGFFSARLRSGRGPDAASTSASIRFSECALPYIAAWAVSGILSSLYLKQWIGRERPSLLAISSPQESFFHSAFPSGHTASAFGMATVIWLNTRGSENRTLGAMAFVWASLVGLSRVYRGVHWPSDVLGGAAVGVLSGCLVMWVLSDSLGSKIAPMPEEECPSDRFSQSTSSERR